MANVGQGIGQIGSAVSDIFAGMAAKDQAKLRAKGLGIEAMGTRLSAESLRIKAGGDIAEAEQYDLATALARQNAAFTQQSTEIKQFQLDRQINQTIGGARADIAAAGMAESGSAIDILRDSASQGALAKAVLGQQGLITEAGYEEQAKSYEVMSRAGRATATAEMGIAAQTDVIAGEQDRLAFETLKAGQRAETGSFISGAIKGLAAIASFL